MHQELLEARCPSATFEFVETGSEHCRHTPSCALDDEDKIGMGQFVLWLMYDTLQHYDHSSDNAERDFLHMFRFASKYQLFEFSDYLSSEFEKLAPSYYGNAFRSHDPSFENLVYAVTKLDGMADITNFIIEQFIRSWVFRHSYDLKDFIQLISNHPEVVQVLFAAVPVVLKQSEKHAVAAFGCRVVPDDKLSVASLSSQEIRNSEAPEARPVEEDASVPPSEPAEPEPAIEDEYAPPPESTEAIEVPPAGYEYRWVKASKKRSKRMKRISVRIEEVAPEPAPADDTLEEPPASYDEPVAEEVSEAVAETESQALYDAVDVPSETTYWSGYV